MNKNSRKELKNIAVPSLPATRKEVNIPILPLTLENKIIKGVYINSSSILARQYEYRNYRESCMKKHET